MEEQFQKTKKKHIAIIGSRGYPVVYSGFETLVKELAEGLVKKDLELQFIAMIIFLKISQKL